ncbi:MAG: endonuclease III [Bacillota bacterium]
MKTLTDRDLRMKILEILSREYSHARTELNYSNPFELLVSTILSAQSTDRQVNKITRSLFKKYSGPEDFARLTPEQLAEEIRGCGLYRNKSRHIIAASRALLEKHGGVVPSTREDLEALPGVGRKTASVVLSNAFGQEALAVDTHVHRVSNRLGLAQSTDVRVTEEQLCALIPRDQWSQAHHWLIYHGRRVCKARKPLCHVCKLAEYCRWRKNHSGGGEGKKDE